MKAAVSIPDDAFEGAERLARRTGKSRGKLFSDALREYLARHTPDEVTEAMNRTCAGLGDPGDRFVSSAAAFWSEASGDRAGRGLVADPVRGFESRWLSFRATR